MEADSGCTNLHISGSTTGLDGGIISRRNGINCKKGTTTENQGSGVKLMG